MPTSAAIAALRKEVMVRQSCQPAPGVALWCTVVEIASELIGRPIISSAALPKLIGSRKNRLILSSPLPQGQLILERSAAFVWIL